MCPWCPQTPAKRHQVANLCQLLLPTSVILKKPTATCL